MEGGICYIVLGCESENDGQCMEVLNCNVAVKQDDTSEGWLGAMMELLIYKAKKKPYKISLGTKEFLIGRGKTCDLVLEDPRVSRHHARIQCINGRYLFEDLDSSNGSYINGELCIKKFLEANDIVLVGNNKLKVMKGSLDVNSDLPTEKPFDKQEPVEVQIVPHLENEQIHAVIDGKKSTILEFEDKMSKEGQFRKAAKNLSILYKTVNVLNSILDEGRLMQEMVNLVEEVISADRYVVLLKDQHGTGFHPKIIRRKQKARSYVPVAISQNMMREVVKKNRSVIFSAVSQDKQLQASESMIIYGIKSAMCAPIATKDHLFGIVYLDSLSKIDQFREDDLRLLAAMAQQVGIAIDNVRLYDEVHIQEGVKQELQIARRIQQKQLPKSFPDSKHLDVDFMNITAEEVGGDYYDFFCLEESHLGFVIADVSGKGVPGALVIAMFRALLRSSVKDTKDPAQVLRSANNFLYSSIEM